MKTGVRELRFTVCAALVVAAAAGGCADGRDESSRGWTTSEAESSVRDVRGLPVRLVECRGMGEPERDGRTVRFERFACVAGARNPWERFDSVAVRFELLPRRAYDGSLGGYELAKVSFTGGPGVP